MPTSTVEDYLKTILLAEQRLPEDRLVTMGDIAKSLSVVPGTVTAMVKTLEKSGMLRYEPYAGVRLTEEGRSAALDVIRRHRLIELFLVEILGLDWSEVHEEAERLEHAMSDKLIERVDALLGYPRVDPHGDPIPDLQGKMVRRTGLINLSDCQAGGDLRIARVSDQDEAFLRFAKKHGLKPGAQLNVFERDPVASAVTVQADQHPPVTLGRDAAAKLWVEPHPASESRVEQDESA